MSDIDPNPWRTACVEARAALRESQAREAVLHEAIRLAIFAMERQIRAVEHITGLPYLLHALDGFGEGAVARHPGAAGLRAALASPSAAAAELLRRLAELEQGRAVEEYGTEQAFRQRDAALADRDRWLGHVRALVAWASGVAPDPDAVGDARRDLEQHDGGGKP